MIFRTYIFAFFAILAAEHALAEPIAVSSSSTSNLASENRSKSTLKNALQNETFEESTEITDAKIRAESGSRSKYSAKFNLSYYGPTLNDVSSKQQPNPDNSNAPKNTALAGSLSVRYRFSKDSTFGFGTGAKAVTPNYGIDRFDVNNPYLNYDYTHKVGRAQIRHSPGVSLITIPEYRNIGETAAINFDQSIAFQIGDSPIFATFDDSASYYLYNRGYRPGPRKKGGDGNSQRYSLTIYPGLKYRLSDRLSFSTSTAIGYYNPRENDSSLVLTRSTVTQRLGVAWAFTRDVYIQPYVDVYPSALAFDTTTMNISTIFSVL